MSFSSTIESRSYGAILAVLRSDPTLIANNVTVWPDFGDRQTLRPNVPSAAQMPLVRVWPKGYSARRETERTHYGEWTLNVECFAATFDPRAAMDLWGAVRSAWWPLDPVRAAQVVGLMTVTDATGRLLRGKIGHNAEHSASIGTDDYGVVAVAELVLPIEIVVG